MIKYGEHSYRPDDNESILDCLLRHGVEIPYSCRSGVCQTCMVRAVDGNPTDDSQKGLKQSQISQNYFLACSCNTQNDIEIVLPDVQNSRYTTTVVDKEFLTDSIIRLRVSVPDSFKYYAGQFVNIFKTDTIARSYSLASVPGVHNYLEFHVQVIPDGMVSSWIANDINKDSQIIISDAIGDCIYIGDAQSHPLLLIGTGTGLAPLAGIIETALHNGHRHDIFIYHGSRLNSELYLDEQLSTLAESRENIHYYPCVSREPARGKARQGRASDLALEDNHDLKNCSVYLCGNPDMVNNTKRKIFLAGASLQNIHSDPFVFK